MRELLIDENYFIKQQNSLYMANQGIGNTNPLTRFERFSKWVERWKIYLSLAGGLGLLNLGWVLWANYGHSKISITLTKKPEIFYYL